MPRSRDQAARLKKKLARLINLLRQMQSALIAYSGGADSSLLLEAARQALGGNILAVTADSPIYPQEELRFARRMTARLGIKHKILKTAQLDNPAFLKNPVKRCYYCKKELFKRLSDIAKRRGIGFVLDGSNVSDSADFRPGIQAKREFGVRSPLEECAIDKDDIRQLSRMLGLSTRDKPATVCLASRIPYGQRILLKDLKMIGQAEEYIRRLGIRQVRLRHYNLDRSKYSGAGIRLARIELEKKDIPRFAAGRRRLRLARYLKRLGYDYVTLDLEGYCRGSLNRGLTKP